MCVCVISASLSRFDIPFMLEMHERNDMTKGPLSINTAIFICSESRNLIQQEVKDDQSVEILNTALLKYPKYCENNIYQAY